MFNVLFRCAPSLHDRLLNPFIHNCTLFEKNDCIIKANNSRIKKNTDSSYYHIYLGSVHSKTTKNILKLQNLEDKSVIFS